METTGLEQAGAQPATPSVPAAPAAAASRRRRLQFTGTGREYFGIWIVNLLLTIVTLGIYSAWAKVRKMQYFYRNTQLDGSAFEYHGDPVAILKGRILAVVAFVVYRLALTLLGAYALIAMAGVIAALPWLLTQSYRFRLHNSSYRGLRFRFEGPLSYAYLIFGVPALMVLTPGALAAAGLSGDPQHPARGFAIGVALVYLALALIWPYLHFSFKRWQHGHAYYGTARASFHAGAWDFYATYLQAGLLMLGVGVVGGILISVFGAGASGPPQARSVGAMIATILLMYAGLLAVVPLVSASIQNAVWSGTRVKDVCFASDVRVGRLIGITLTNLLMVVASLGLLIPFAWMRLTKYKVESIEVLDVDALGRFVAEGRGAGVGAAGEGAVDVMDLDFGL